MMGLIRHLAWRDLRSQRIPLSVWAAVLALKNYVTGDIHARWEKT